MMDELAEAMDAEGVTWWLDYGTLLGAVRNKGLIPHDKDADLGFLATDREAIHRVGERMKALGRYWDFSAPRDGRFKGGDRVKLRLSSINKTNVDLFPWYRDGDVMDRRNYISIDRYKGREFPVDKLFPLTTVEWEGRHFPAPADPEWFCEHRYGKTWKTPLYRNNMGVAR